VSHPSALCLSACYCSSSLTFRCSMLASLGPVLHALGLTSTKSSSRTTYPIAQGAEMGRPAHLTGTLVTDAAGKVAECLIGGEVRKVGEGWVAVP
jgi:predicted PhzF superfamily epimerase YddE/YHI9